MKEAAFVSAASRFLPNQCTRATRSGRAVAGGAAAFVPAVSFFSVDSDFLQPDPSAIAAARRPKPKDLRNIKGRHIQQKDALRKPNQSWFALALASEACEDAMRARFCGDSFYGGIPALPGATADRQVHPAVVRRRPRSL